MSVSFDITIPAACTENKLELRLEVTEQYEADKYHVVVFEDRGPNEPGEYYETRGFDSGNELLNYIRTLNEWGERAPALFFSEAGALEPGRKDSLSYKKK